MLKEWKKFIVIIVTNTEKRTTSTSFLVIVLHACFHHLNKLESFIQHILPYCVEKVIHKLKGFSMLKLPKQY